jgi:fluoroacetyl-CoA thioesterase
MEEDILMSTTLVPGIAHTLSLEVNDHLLVTAFTPHFSGFADLPPVFATAFMVGFMEWACMEALKPYLLNGENTVGTHVYLSHVAPTPMGMPLETKVTAQVELMEVKGRTLRFRVDCYDECGLIGSGFHERTVIDTVRFMAKVREKARVIVAKAA